MLFELDNYVILKEQKENMQVKNSFINLKYQFEQLALLLQSLYTSINMAEFLSSN